jgi:histidinol-phosphate phosphatase family protein
MKKIVFLDRDGTLNKCIASNDGLITKESEIELIANAAEGVKLLNEAGFITVIVTNQPQVAKGLCTYAEIERINAKVVKSLAAKGARVDAVYFCPHHPEKGFAGERSEYKTNCDCRKPGIGMLEKGAKQFRVPLSSCYLVGDHARDVKAAENAGIKSIFVRTGSTEPPAENKKYPAKPYVELSDMVEAAHFIIAYEASLTNIRALIVAGGLGKRLAPLTESIPKPLLPVDGKPVLEHQIAWLKREGVTNIILSTGYLSEKIEHYFGAGKKFGVKLTYSVEKEERGTGGAIKLAEKKLGSETFIMLYGDLLIDLDLRRLLAYHKAKGGLATMTLHPSSHPYDSDMLELGEGDKVIRFLGKPKPGDQFVNIGNAGLYCFEPAILKYFPTGKSMLDKEVLPGVIAKGGAIYGFVTQERIADMGTHDRYAKHRG